MSRLNGAHIPEALEARLDRVDGEPRAVRDLAVEVGADLAASLLERGAPGLHLYTLNFSSATRMVLRRLGLGPST
jgi:methylenetetrahydrofolate reductase (NADPH)